MMTIGITGASGQLAGSILRYLLARISPSEIVAVTRTPDRIQAFAGQSVRVRAGDFNDPSSLSRAFDGVKRLLIVPTSDLIPDVRPRQHVAAIDAAIAAGVEHIIYISTVGAHPGPPDGLPESHFATEQRLIGSRASWNVLRMSLYAEIVGDAAKTARATGAYAALPGAPIAYVARDNVAAASAALLLGKGRAGYTYHATGPQALTQTGVAQIISQVTGVAVTFSPQTPAQYEAGLTAAGLPAALVDVLSRFQLDVREGAFDLVTNDVERLTGTRAESLADVLARRLEPAG